MSPTAEARLQMRRELMRWLHWLAVATVALYIAAAVIAGAVLHQSQVSADQSRTNRAALCAFRKNLEQTAKSSREFLNANPRGIPGITPQVIQQGINRQEATISTLAVLECP